MKVSQFQPGTLSQRTSVRVLLYIQKRTLLELLWNYSHEATPRLHSLQKRRGFRWSTCPPHHSTFATTNKLRGQISSEETEMAIAEVKAWMGWMSGHAAREDGWWGTIRVTTGTAFPGLAEQRAGSAVTRLSPSSRLWPPLPSTKRADLPPTVLLGSAGGACTSGKCGTELEDLPSVVLHHAAGELEAKDIHQNGQWDLKTANNLTITSNVTLSSWRPVRPKSSFTVSDLDSGSIAFQIRHYTVYRN